MIIVEEVPESGVAVSTQPQRPNGRRAKVIGAATLTVVGAAVLALAVGSATPDARVRPSATVEPTTGDAGDAVPIAVDKRIEGSRSRDDTIRDLVERGLVPAATLDDGTRITTPGLQSIPSRDNTIRDLVERGLVPAATLDDGTQIATPGLQPIPTRDDVVRDLVERGLVPAATLDDGTRITTPGLRP
jgi:membrane-associated protease RseP (regulator of RpoE activity)